MCSLFLVFVEIVYRLIAIHHFRILPIVSFLLSSQEKNIERRGTFNWLWNLRAWGGSFQRGERWVKSIISRVVNFVNNVWSKLNQVPLERSAQDFAPSQTPETQHWQTTKLSSFYIYFLSINSTVGSESDSFFRAGYRQYIIARRHVSTNKEYEKIEWF